MTDGVIKGTGNSRYLKSSISADTTLAQLIAMLRDGTFPVDFNGINAEGWTTLATALSKANLLTDTTASKINTNLGATAPTTVNEAISALAYKPTKIVTGSYTGTGTYGSSNPNSLTFSGQPMLVVICAFSASAMWTGIFVKDAPYSPSFPSNGDAGGSLVTTFNGNSVQWYNSGDATKQLNNTNVVYKYSAVIV